MAQRKGLLQRVIMGKDNLPDFTPDKLPSSRFSQFKDIFFGRLGAMAKINLLVMLFALPIVGIVIVSVLTKMMDNTMIPHSGNYGIGFPIATDNQEVLQLRNFWFDLQMYALLIPAIIILFIGLSGAFYVMRRFVWGEGVGVVSHFFHGIKDNLFPFIFSSLFLGLSFVMVMLNLSSYAIFVIDPILKVIGTTLTIVLFLLLMCMAIFITTQAVTYKLKFRHLLKNSFVLAIGLLPTNIIVLAASAIPVVLLLLFMSAQLIGMMLITMFIFVGLSFIILVWTVYAHWVFDRFINPKLENAPKNRGLYVMSEEEKQLKKEQELKAKNTRFNNPLYINRTIKSIDDGSTFTPLTDTFSRADLLKLKEEKEIVKNEIDADYADIENPIAEKPDQVKKATTKKPMPKSNEGSTPSNKNAPKATFKRKK